MYGDALAPYRAGRLRSDAEVEWIECTTHRLRDFEVLYLERHHNITQTFIPLGGDPIVVAVAPADAPIVNGLPDLDEVRAFIVPGTMAVNLHLGTWHEVPFPTVDGQTTLLTSHSGVTTGSGSLDASGEIDRAADAEEKRDVRERAGVRLMIDAAALVLTWKAARGQAAHRVRPLVGDAEERRARGSVRRTGAQGPERGRRDRGIHALVTVPAGWSGDLGGGERRVELFCPLFARCAGGRRRVGRRRLVRRRPGLGARDRRPAAGPTLVLLMVEDALPAGPAAAINVIDSHERRLELPGPNVPAGLAIKRLRVDADRGDWTWIGAGAPGYLEERAEIHPTVEEAFVLRGDVLLGERGEMGPGDYFWRPPNVRHGPIYCRSGRLILFRTKGGGLTTTYEAVPGWRDLVAAYRAREPLYQGP